MCYQKEIKEVVIITSLWGEVECIYIPEKPAKGPFSDIDADKYPSYEDILI